MSAQHTPGPWFINGPFIGPRLSPDSGILLKVARVAGDEGDGECIANARLIAAAPELLELACQYLSDLHHPPQGDSLKRRIERAEKIIAKARGQ